MKNVQTPHSHILHVERQDYDTIMLFYWAVRTAPEESLPLPVPWRVAG